MKNLTFIFLTAILIFGCNTDDTQESEINTTIIFGEIYGQCVGDCRNLFLLTDQGIYEDSNTDTDFGTFIDQSEWETTTFNNEPLAIDKFELAKELLEIPNLLLTSNSEIENQTLADFDYFVQIKVNGVSKTFIFDSIKETADSEIKLYMNTLIKISNQLIY